MPHALPHRRPRTHVSRILLPVLVLGLLLTSCDLLGREDNEPPTARFAVSTDGLTVELTNQSNDPDGSIESHRWRFGDGNTSTEENPSHTYESDGTYTVSLTVTDDDGATDSTSQDVATMNDSPSAQFTFESDGRTVTFSNQSTDPDGSIASVEWDFGDGETSTEESPSHTYGELVPTPVEMTVTDDAGATASATQEVFADARTFEVTVENVGSATPFLKSGAFDTPEGASGAGPATPGKAFEFSFTAGHQELPGTGMQLSLATMFAQSNDMFYGFQPGGMTLFENGSPRGLSGPVDVTEHVSLWDAGTEVDEEPGMGSNQAPRQSGTNTGPVENGVITEVTDTDGDGVLENDGFEYPAVADVIRVTVQSAMDEESGSYRFTVRVENVSDQSGATANGEPIPLSPGTYGAHFDRAPSGADVTYFAAGETAPEGIECIAEDGSADTHRMALAELTGVTVPLSPGAFAAHTAEVQAFATGESASAGIEGVAEDGDPAALAEELSLERTDQIVDTGVFDTADGAPSAGPIGPGASYRFAVNAAPDHVLSLITMYVQSNDLYYAFAPGGTALFDESGSPVSGDVTGELRLYDAGTEGDEEPGAGLDQAPRQSGADTGPAGEGSIVTVTGEDDGYTYPETSTIVRITITPQ